MECVSLPAEKDWTDLQAAYELAAARGAKEILLTGCTGGRQDHHLSALELLETARNQGISARDLYPWRLLSHPMRKSIIKCNALCIV